MGDGDGDGEADDERADEERYRYGDVDASVRALRPRSSRRGSWESEASGWSARVNGATGSIMGTPNGVEKKSLWTSGSHRTGARSVLTEDGELDGEDKQRKDDEEASPAKGPEVHLSHTKHGSKSSPTDPSIPEAIIPKSASSQTIPSAGDTAAPVAVDKVLETPKGVPLTLDEVAPEPALPPLSDPVTDKTVSNS